jgi:hypothetical protein
LGIVAKLEFSDSEVSEASSDNSKSVAILGINAGLLDLKKREWSGLDSWDLVLKDGGTQRGESDNASVFFLKTNDFLAGKMLIFGIF